MVMLTDNQSNVLAFINRFREEHQMPPTQTEISAHFKWGSVTAARDVLIALERKGRIRINKGKARGIYVLSSGEAAGASRESVVV